MHLWITFVKKYGLWGPFGWVEHEHLWTGPNKMLYQILGVYVQRYLYMFPKFGFWVSAHCLGRGWVTPRSHLLQVLVSQHDKFSGTSYNGWSAEIVFIKNLGVLGAHTLRIWGGFDPKDLPPSPTCYCTEATTVTLFLAVISPNCCQFL